MPPSFAPSHTQAHPVHEWNEHATHWQQHAQCLNLPRTNGINQGTVCLDDHPLEVQQRTALIWVKPTTGETLFEDERYTFSQLSQVSNQVANALHGLGMHAGERAFIFLDRIPELYISVFGCLKHQLVTGPLFSAFGHDAILDRLQDSEARLVITSPSLKPRIDAIRHQLPKLAFVIVVERHEPHLTVPLDATKGEFAYESLVHSASTSYNVPYTPPETLSIMHYTSGTTGKPKGAVHTHQAVVSQSVTAKYVLDLEGSHDVYWCTADPGWVTGTSYGMFGPWSLGVTQVVYAGGFNPEVWYRLMQTYGVTVWYTAPTALRMLMKAGNDCVAAYPMPKLRHICSVGEPLNPEAMVWGEHVFGKTIYDTWWQTETGSMHIVNRPGLPVKHGSMGKPFTGVEATVLDEQWNPLSNGSEGCLALKPLAPSMFATYWNNLSKYESRFKNGWYLTGDRARVDEDGYFWFIGRDDDVINTAGHLVGPFEVESALVEHPAVAEAAVIGIPDPERMEIIKAFVALRQGFEESEALRQDITRFVRQRLAAHAYPRELEILPSLPKTRSGKIMRRLLKAKELGQPIGDTSTLED
ncbi:MAG: acetate--CoA ligase [Vampirovibrionales bacterium]